MVESFVDQDMITAVETSIGDYLETSQPDYSNIWKRAFVNMLLDFDSMDLDTRQLCERLEIQSSFTDGKTAAFTGAISDEDFARRMRLVIPVSTVTSAVFTLQGTDDDGSNYEDITLMSNNGSARTTVTIESVAVGDNANSYVLTRPYKRYRLKLVSATSVIYTAYLLEEVYTSLHLERTIADIYKTVKATAGDNWQDKWEAYELMYRKRLAEGRFRVDYTDDNVISESESEKRSNRVRFRV
jgi:hypothetical protein